MKFASVKVLTTFLFLAGNVAAEKIQKQPQEKTHWNDKRLKAGDGKERLLDAQDINQMKHHQEARKLSIGPLDRIGDGFCDDFLNTAKDNFDGGDCCPSTFQASTHGCSNATGTRVENCYDPNAADRNPSIGNGECDQYFNTDAFNYDEGDCCPSTCQVDSTYGCFSANKRYCKDPSAPEHLPNPEAPPASHPWIGDGECDYDLNFAEHNFDGGDCCPSTCQVGTYDCTTADKRKCKDPSTPELLARIGDGYCDYDLNLAEHNFDGGDCCPSTCQVGTYGCTTAWKRRCKDPSAPEYLPNPEGVLPESHPWVGDGECDYDLNTANYSFDGGDCCLSSCQVGMYDCSRTNNYECIDPNHAADENPIIGDGYCDPRFNTADLNFDEGDCCLSTCQIGDYDCSGTDNYECYDPNHAADENPIIGNGYCTDHFNTAEFNFDGGDCCSSTCQIGDWDCPFENCKDPNAAESLVASGGNLLPQRCSLVATLFAAMVPVFGLL